MSTNRTLPYFRGTPWQRDTCRDTFGQEAHLDDGAGRWSLEGYVMPGRMRYGVPRQAR